MAGSRYTKADGTEVQLSGKVQSSGAQAATDKNWVDKRHPLRDVWVEAEERSRASYIGTRSALVPYLVPHRFEGEDRPEDLPRARFGYGMKLNSAYLAEIMGHVRSAPARYNWGPLSPGEDEVTAAPKEGTTARLMWDDATRTGIPWTNFFEGEVLEWLLSSPGGVVIVDTPAVGADTEVRTQADEARLGIRPYVLFNPMSQVEDAGRGPYGYRWLQIAETVDDRGPRGEDRNRDESSLHILYEIDPDTNEVRIGRYDADGDLVGPEITWDDYIDPQGKPILPVVEVKYGSLEGVEWVGCGLLQGLDDVVIDLFNTLSEAREGYRDAAFGFISYKGADADGVVKYLRDGSRFVPVGADPSAELTRISGDPQEVDAGLRLLEVGIKAWTLSARRNAAKAQAEAAAQSGVSLQAEFSLDLKPLLIAVTETLDAIESAAMYRAGLMAGYSPEELADVGVERSTEFRLEEEDSRIARKVEEFVKSIPLPSTAQTRLVERWIEATGLIDMDEVVEWKRDEVGEDGQITEVTERLTMREIILREAEEDAMNTAKMLHDAMAFTPGLPNPVIPPEGF